MNPLGPSLAPHFSWIFFRFASRSSSGISPWSTMHRFGLFGGVGRTILARLTGTVRVYQKGWTLVASGRYNVKMYENVRVGDDWEWSFVWDSFGLCRGHYRFVLAKQCSNKHLINGKPEVQAGLCHLSSRRALVLKGFAVLPWYKSKVSNPQGRLCTLDVPVSHCLGLGHSTISCVVHVSQDLGPGRRDQPGAFFPRLLSVYPLVN